MKICVICLSYDTMKRWESHFQTGHSSAEDELRNGRQSIMDDPSKVAGVGVGGALVFSNGHVIPGNHD